jgi:16S rRNA (cytosine1402-N4)-methyltransferase
LQYYNINGVDGILADLGISSHHIDEQERGFAFRFDAPLDMRMNQQQYKSAETVVNEYSEEDLIAILKNYGEIKGAYKLVKAIVAERYKNRIVTTGQLVKIAEKFSPAKYLNKFLAQIFQALRIEVNEELESLKAFLMATKEALNPGGRLVVITYHSLEDRIVKNFMRNGDFSGEDATDMIYGGKDSFFYLVNRKVITPSDEELKINSRSRSAKLRIAERIK